MVRIKRKPQKKKPDDTTTEIISRGMRMIKPQKKTTAKKADDKEQNKIQNKLN